MPLVPSRETVVSCGETVTVVHVHVTGEDLESSASSSSSEQYDENDIDNVLDIGAVVTVNNTEDGNHGDRNLLGGLQDQKKKPYR